MRPNANRSQQGKVKHRQQAENLPEVASLVVEWLRLEGKDGEGQDQKREGDAMGNRFDTLKCLPDGDQQDLEAGFDQQEKRLRHDVQVSLCLLPQGP